MKAHVQQIIVLPAALVRSDPDSGSSADRAAKFGMAPGRDIKPQATGFAVQNRIGNMPLRRESKD